MEVKTHTITRRAGKQLFVTKIEQYAVPAYMHGDDIQDAIVVDGLYWTIDFHGFKYRAAAWDDDDNDKNVIFGKALDYFRVLGVHLEGGTYVNVGWVEAGRHKPMHGETVLVTGPGYTDTSTWTGTNWHASNGRKDPITHWQRLPAGPEKL